MTGVPAGRWCPDCRRPVEPDRKDERDSLGCWVALAVGGPAYLALAATGLQGIAWLIAVVVGGVVALLSGPPAPETARSCPICGNTNLWPDAPPSPAS